MALAASGVLSAAALNGLVRPSGLQDAQWQGIEEGAARLHDAVARDDRALAIGCAKELAEAVAKIVMVVRGETPSGNEDFAVVITKAHKHLERQPGVHLSSNVPMMKIVQGAKTIVSQLAEIRNTYGTGHGRAQNPEILQELLDVTLHGAGLWVRWALGRLDVMAQGMPASLIDDLASGIFTGGRLTERLVAADLPQLEEAVQRRLGVAVAQRAMRGTFLVQDEGIEACALSNDVQAWPAAYRQGAFEGLFLNELEQLTIDAWSVKWAARLLNPLPDEAAATIAEVVDKIRGLPLFLDVPTRAALTDSLTSTTIFLPIDARPAWADLAEAVRTAP